MSKSFDRQFTWQVIFPTSYLSSIHPFTTWHVTLLLKIKCWSDTTESMWIQKNSLPSSLDQVSSIRFFHNTIHLGDFPRVLIAKSKPRAEKKFHQQTHFLLFVIDVISDVRLLKTILHFIFCIIYISSTLRGNGKHVT